MATFLSRTLTKDQVEKLVDHVHVDGLSPIDRVNGTIQVGLLNNDYLFIRKGISNFD